MGRLIGHIQDTMSSCSSKTRFVVLSCSILLLFGTWDIASLIVVGHWSGYILGGVIACSITGIGLLLKKLFGRGLNLSEILALLLLSGSIGAIAVYYGFWHP